MFRGDISQILTARKDSFTKYFFTKALFKGGCFTFAVFYEFKRDVRLGQVRSVIQTVLQAILAAWGELTSGKCED